MKKLWVSVLLLAPWARAQTNLRAWHTNGQTFLLWEHSVPVDSDTTYDIYRSPGPINSLHDAIWVGRVFAGDGSNYRLYDILPGARWVLPDGAGGSVPVDTNEAYFVFTPHAPDTAYYAVVLTGDTTVSPNNTAGPLAEDTGKITPYIQYQDSAVVIYGHWIDGRADTAGARASYPVMGNEWSNGYGFNLAVWFPFTGLPPTDTPMVVWIHGGYGNFVQIADLAPFMAPFGLVATLDDPLQTKVSDTLIDQNTYWFGYQKGMNRFKPWLPGPYDTVKSYTAKRVWWEVSWLRENWDVNPYRVSITGPSMGGQGTLFHTQTRPDLFSAGLAHVPLLRLRSLFDPNNTLFIFGDTITNLPTDLPGNPGVYDALSQDWRLAQPHEDWPFTVLVSGVNDERVRWEVNARVYCQLDSARTGFWLYWDERGHMGDEWQGAHFYLSKHVNAAFLTRFRRGESFPGFSGTDVWPDSAGRQPDTSDAWGTWGGYLDWEPASVVDSAEAWSAKIWVVFQSPYPNDIPESDTVLANLTPRQTTNFRPVPGYTYAWDLVRTSPGDTLQKGTAIAAEDSTVTVVGLLLIKDTTILRIHGPVGISETGPGSSGNRLLGNAPNPFGRETRICFWTAGAEDLRIVVYDVSGRLAARKLLGKLGPGYHEIPITRADLVPGVYFYRLEAHSWRSGFARMVLQ